MNDPPVAPSIGISHYRKFSIIILRSTAIFEHYTPKKRQPRDNLSSNSNIIRINLELISRNKSILLNRRYNVNHKYIAYIK